MRRAPAASCWSRPTPIQPNGALQTVVFFGAAAYAAAPAVYDASVFINTPITVDPLGNVFFGFIVTAANPAGLESGIARIGADGVATWVSARHHRRRSRRRQDGDQQRAGALARPRHALRRGQRQSGLGHGAGRLPARARQRDARAQEPGAADRSGQRLARPRQRRRHRVADGRAGRRRLLRRSRDGVRHAQRPRLAAPLRRHARHPLHARRLRLGRHRVGGADVDRAVVHRQRAVPVDGQVQQLPRRRLRRRRQPGGDHRSARRPGRSRSPACRS